ncbi:MAG: hypothetical protein FWD48_12430 [Oscillospiraceae bacterium]|nr:hypothetical protein [Oscillospiraceae bacterium]
MKLLDKFEEDMLQIYINSCLHNEDDEYWFDVDTDKIPKYLASSMGTIFKSLERKGYVQPHRPIFGIKLGSYGHLTHYAFSYFENKKNKSGNK